MVLIMCQFRALWQGQRATQSALQGRGKNRLLLILAVGLEMLVVASKPLLAFRAHVANFNSFPFLIGSDEFLHKVTNRNAGTKHQAPPPRKYALHIVSFPERGVTKVPVIAEAIRYIYEYCSHTRCGWIRAKRYPEDEQSLRSVSVLGYQ